ERAAQDTNGYAQTGTNKASGAARAYTSHEAAAEPTYHAGYEPISSTELLETAHVIGERLADLAFADESETGWIGLVATQDRGWSMGALSLDPSEGLPAVALFLAELSAVTRSARFDKLARGAFAGVRRLLTE